MDSSTDVLQGLLYLEEIDFPTYYSPGAYERATELAEIAKNSVHYLDEFYENKVQNRLLVLNEGDWTKRIEYPYGVIAGRNNYLWYPAVKEDNPVFIEMIPYYENSPEDLRHEHSKLLSNSDSPFLYSKPMNSHIVGEVLQHLVKFTKINQFHNLADDRFVLTLSHFLSLLSSSVEGLFNEHHESLFCCTHSSYQP